MTTLLIIWVGIPFAVFIVIAHLLAFNLIAPGRRWFAWWRPYHENKVRRFMDWLTDGGA